jgi:DtxR family transcriptional regulator, Mn-dependent transcriptional regulator
MATDKVSKNVQDYVKTIYALQCKQRPVSNGALKARLSEIEPRSAAAVTEMIQTLVKLNLVRYEPYQGVELTAAGERVALEVIRHHRLLELYLHEALGVPWDEVHAEAEQLEHALSPGLAERIAEHLGQPQYDPHGAPIPSRDLDLPQQLGEPLLHAALHVPLRIVEVDDTSPELLRYLHGLGLTPGQSVTLVERAPFDGPLHVRVDDQTHAIGQQTAGAIRVVEVHPN